MYQAALYTKDINKRLLISTLLELIESGEKGRVKNEQVQVYGWTYVSVGSGIHILSF